MAKGHRAGDSWKSRRFKIANQAGLAELRDIRFDNERQMQILIEHNIETLFPGLKFLGTEFEIDGGELRLDTVAFDTTLDTFVVLEYKNRLDKGAVEQARTYLNSMRRYRGDLVALHSRKMKCMARDSKSFKWKNMYAIVMAPEFGEYQVLGADEDSSVELYEIGMYNNYIMLIERTRSRPPSFYELHY